MSWQKLGINIDGEAGGDNSGWSVSLSSNGSIVAIGAIKNDGNDANSGHVRVYGYNESNVWTQLGQDIDGEANNDFSGRSLSLSNNGSIVAIGANGNDDNGNLSGQVRVYKYNSISDSWIKLGQDIDGEAEGDKSGFAVSLSNNGSIVAIGAYTNDGNGESSGHVRVYGYNESNVWTQLGQDIDGEANNDFSGRCVSLSNNGSIVAIGAHGNDDNGNLSGHVRVYQYNSISDSWIQLGQDIDGEAGGEFVGDKSGFAVSLSNNGSIVAIGAY